MIKSPTQDTPGFSPAKIAASPGSKISQGKNLTGPPRLVRDNAADVHSSIQQWNKLYTHGISIIKKIIEIKVDETFPSGLTKYCEDLEKVCDEMDTIVDNLRLLADKMEKISSLPDTSCSMDGVLFTTWPMDKFGKLQMFQFVSTVHGIYDAYKKEASVKRIILENVAHDHRESLKALHMAAWLYQPFIPDSIETDLESMLVETKLRQVDGKS